MKKHKHHVKPVHKGGTDTPENLVDLDFIEHAKIHAERFLAGEDEFFDNRHTGWPYLPEDLRSKVLKKQGEKTREMNLRKAEEGTHPFQTEEFRKENSKRTRERNLELSFKDMHPAQIASREGRHPWQTEDYRDKARVRMINLNKDKIEKGEPSYSQTQEGKEAIGRRQVQLIKEGNHFFGSEEHKAQARLKTTERNKANKGAKHWVNSRGERKFQKESPGPEWQNGQKWKD